MTERKNKISDSMKVLAAMLEAIKRDKKRYNLTLEAAFENKINGSYEYAKSWYEETYNKKYYTQEQYKNILYNFISGNISELHMPILYYLTGYFNGYDYKNLDNASFKIIKEYVEMQLSFELEERKEIERLERDTQEIRRILGRHNYTMALECIIPFIKLEEAGKLRNNGAKSVTMLVADMFNYGFILGKKAERARKHKQTT